MGEIVDDVLEKLWLCVEVLFGHLCDWSMEHTKVGMKLHQYLVKELGVFFLEERCLELIVGDGLCLNVIGLSFTVDRIWMLDNHVQPNIRLYLLGQMRVLQGSDALDWVLIIRKWLKEAHDTLRDSRLLSSLVDVYRLWIKEQNLGICKLLLLWLLCFRFECWVDCEYWADGQLWKDCLHCKYIIVK